SSLARGGIRGSQLTVGKAPDSLDAVAGTQKQCGGGERDKCQQQGVFDEILSLLVIQKVSKRHRKLQIFLSVFGPLGHETRMRETSYDGNAAVRTFRTGRGLVPWP